MSLLPTCAVCDALLRGYGGNTRCKRCEQPCDVCGGDVAYCQHPLPNREQIVEVERLGPNRIAA